MSDVEKLSLPHLKAGVPNQKRLGRAEIIPFEPVRVIPEREWVK